MGKLIELNDIPNDLLHDERFIVLKHGSRCSGVVRGSPFEQAFHWNGKHYEFCSESASCPHCKTSNPQKRYAFNFVEVDGNCMTQRLLELPRGVAAKIRQIYEEYGPNAHISIDRTGIGMNSRYTVTFKRKLERHEVEELEQIPVLDLDEIYTAKKFMAQEAK